jgi:hypothetical protein
VLYIHPESEEYINDQGRPHCQEGNVDKILANGSSGNAQHLSYPRTNPKYFPLDKVLDLIHATNLDIHAGNNERFVADLVFVTFAAVFNRPACRP